LALAGEALPPPPPSEPLQTVPEHQRRKPVKKPFSDDLPRVDVEIVPPEVLVEGVENFELVGESSRKVLERRPASAVIVPLRYKKFLRKGRNRTAEATEVLVAPAIELPIERGTAGPSMLADTIVRRWQDHQPRNGLEDIYRRENLGLAKSTMCTWHEQLAELVRPLVDAMFKMPTASHTCASTQPAYSRHRAPRLHPRLALPHPLLAARSPAPARPRQLEANSRAAPNSAEAARQRLSTCRAYAACLTSPSPTISTPLRPDGARTGETERIQYTGYDLAESDAVRVFTRALAQTPDPVANPHHGARGEMYPLRSQAVDPSSVLAPQIA
jgi:transposase